MYNAVNRANGKTNARKKLSMVANWPKEVCVKSYVNAVVKFHTLGFRDAHDRHVFNTYSQGKRCQCSVQPDHKDKRSTTSLCWFQRLEMMDNVLVSIDSYGSQAAKYSRSPSPWEEKYQLAENLFGCGPWNDKVNSQRKDKQAINQLCWTQVKHKEVWCVSFVTLPPHHGHANSDV